MQDLERVVWAEDAGEEWGGGEGVGARAAEGGEECVVGVLENVGC